MRVSFGRFGIAFVNAALIALIFFVAPASWSQKSDQTRSRLLTSYGHAWPSDELEASLDFLAQTLAENVASYAYIIVYRGYHNPPGFFHSCNPPGLFRRHSLGVMSYLSRIKHVPRERILMVDGGMQPQFHADVWVMADGEKPPNASPDTTPQIQETPGLYDEYICNSESDLAISFNSGRLDGFAKALRSDPSATGYIIGYAQCLDIAETVRVSKYGTEEYVSREYKQFDPAGTGKRIGRSEQRRLLKFYGIPRSRVAVLDGGYRNSQMVELWIMPTGAEAPKATPTADPKKRK